MEPKIESDDRGRRIAVDTQLLGVHGIHREHVTVVLAGRWRGTAELLRPVVVTDLHGAGGQPLDFPLPAPADSSVTDAGMSKTTQCQNPLPVGASGSKQVTAKLLVCAGNPSHRSCGEVFPAANT